MTNIAYTTATNSAPVANLSSELMNELQLPYEVDALYENVQFDSYCFVCSRSTSHVDEHDELVEAGQARYEYETGSVFWV